MKKFLLVIIALQLSIACSADPVDIGEVKLHPLSSGTYSLTGKFNDSISAEFLFDTGASMVMISKKLFRDISRHQQLRSNGKVAATIATGKVKVIPTYTLPNLVLENGCNLGPVDVAVINGATRNLIGLNALSKLGRITIDTQENKLLVSDCDSILLNTEKVAAK